MVVTMCLKPNASTPITTGSTATKMKRQGSTDRMSPEMAGPMAGATAITTEIIPMRLPLVSGGSRFITVVMSSGSMTAVPKACTTRATSSTSKPGADAASAVPSTNTDMATRCSVRVGKRCSK